MTTRRRVLTILAGAAALPMLGTVASATPARWQGIALGAEAQIILDHPNAEALLAQAVAEIDRLEGIFSLHRDSELTRLNRDGTLPNPAFELVELLSICSGLNARTGGAFDPTIQPLWALYAQSYAAGWQPDEAAIENTLALTGWHHVRVSPAAVSFDRAGVMLTLNGIAQGYIADRIAALFRANDVANVLVNTGEIMALGKAPSGAAWPIKIGNSAGASLPLSNAAIATSAPLGTTFDASGTAGHILDPRTGRPGGIWPQVSVIAQSAAEADGLSTAFCLLDETEIAAARGATVLEVLL